MSVHHQPDKQDVRERVKKLINTQKNPEFSMRRRTPTHLLLDVHLCPVDVVMDKCVENGEVDGQPDCHDAQVRDHLEQEEEAEERRDAMET